MLGRLFLIVLLLVGAAAVALFATRTGYNVWQTRAEGRITCHYWLGIGMARTEHGEAPGFECPTLLRDVST